ncbi:transcriptional repressor [Coemansia guatemalensis]|uniref:Transcriptional repressor n=1 Tax=Coemansia guatemalensis TaxID=2761395 RepID=A0A9W8HS75_9FUNG|nr:transcriptional repressor [Coemansia guatemalensis]
MSPAQSPSIVNCRPSHLGLWSLADLAKSAIGTPEKQPRSLSIRTSEGRCVSLLNDEVPSSCCTSEMSSNTSTLCSDSGRKYPSSDNGLRLSVPGTTPGSTPGSSPHCLRRTHSSSIATGLPSPQLTPTRLPSLSALIQAVSMVSSDAGEMPPLPPPSTSMFSQSHHLQLHKPSPLQSGLAVSPSAQQVVPRTPAKRKYICGHIGCGKAFTTSGHLSRHYRIHTGEKNYHCLYPGCTSRFSRQDNMMQHYRTHLSPRSRRNRSMRAASATQAAAEYNGALAAYSAAAGSAFCPYKRTQVQHSPSAYSQWTYY